MKAEINRRWPEDPRAAGNFDLSLERRKRAVNVTETCNLVRWSAYAMKMASVGFEVVVVAGSRSGHENRAHTNRRHSTATS